jgi:predicted GH43/DUF377 family glycosyl hydrolase
MGSLLAAAVVVAGFAVSEVLLGFAIFAVIFAWAALAGLWWYAGRHRRAPALKRLRDNPVLEPVPEHWWENEAVFNPAAVVYGGRVHLFYRALGRDGISRIGHASSADGIHFDERTPVPVYDRGAGFEPPKRLSYKTLTYNTDTYASGGGWGGTEDPRAVEIDGRIYMTFELFEGWQALRLAVTSLDGECLNARRWQWAPRIVMSPAGETNKNWVLFPEKINGKFAVLHALTPRVMIDYLDSLESLEEKPIKSNNHRSGRPGRWDALIRGAGAPPIKTKEGWLLLYHGMNPAKNTGYQVGAMLLDLNDPTKVLHQSSEPILKPEEWYENDGKPGVVYATGAVVLNGTLIVYYGGGDKRVAAAEAPLDDFLYRLMHEEPAVLQPSKV